MPKIHADFTRMIEARKAVQKLKEMGFINAHLDIIEKFAAEGAEEINFAGSSNAVSLSSLVLKSNGHIVNVGKAPALASNPIVSGLGPSEESKDISTRLYVTVDEEKLESIKKFLEQAGGKL